MSNILIGKDEKLVIEVNREISRNNSLLKPKGILKNFRNPEYLPRRKKSVTTGNIAFYDLGYLLTEDGWREPELSFPMEYETGDDSTSYQIDDTTSLTDLVAPFNEFFLSLNLEELNSLAHQIEKTEVSTYGISLLGRTYSSEELVSEFETTLEDWSDDNKLKLTDEKLAHENIYFLFAEQWEPFGELSLFTKGEEPLTQNVKITSLPDPDADPVEFQLSKNMDVFLVPSLQRCFLDRVDYAGGGNWAFLGGYQLATRRNYLDPSFAHYHQNVFKNSDFSIDPDYIKDYLLSGFVLYRPSASETYFEQPTSTFPLPTPYELMPFHYGNSKLDQPSKTLKAIIKQNDSYFYVWLN